MHDWCIFKKHIQHNFCFYFALECESSERLLLLCVRPSGSDDHPRVVGAGSVGGCAMADKSEGSLEVWTGDSGNVWYRVAGSSFSGLSPLLCCSCPVGLARLCEPLLVEERHLARSSAIFFLGHILKRS